MRLLSVAVLALAVSLACGATLPFGLILDDGKLGVNFFGFNAAVGVGGRNNADGTGGGLHVEAGTPFGQRAAAGLGGNLRDGHTGGGLYAGATAGGNVKASAGLNGDIFDNGGGRGSLYSRASAGSLNVEKSLDSAGLNSGLGSRVNIGDHETEEPVYLRSRKRKNKKTRVVKNYDRHSDEVISPVVYKEVSVGSRHSGGEIERFREVPVVVKQYTHSRTSNADRGIGYGTNYMNAFLSPSYGRHTEVDSDEEEEETHHRTTNRAYVRKEIEKEVDDRHYRPSNGAQVQKEVTVHTRSHRPGFFEDIFNAQG